MAALCHSSTNKSKSKSAGGGCSSSSSIVSILPPPSSSGAKTLLSQALTLLNNPEAQVDVPPVPTVEAFVKDGADYTVQKVVWWTLKNAQDPPPFSLIHPELHDYVELSSVDPSGIPTQEEYEEVDKLRLDSDEDNQEDEEDDGPPRADLIKESVGRTLVRLESTLRVPGSRVEEERYFKLFEVELEGPEMGKCVPCQTSLAGFQELERHFCDVGHKVALRKLSLDLGREQYEEAYHDSSHLIPFKAQLKKYRWEEAVLLSMQLSSSKALSKTESRLLQSALNEERFILQDDHAQNNAKLKLRYLRKWTKDMDKKWKEMKDKEKIIRDEYKRIAAKYLEDPASHPEHSTEWFAFVKRRSGEVRAKGEDPMSNLGDAWAKVWLEKMSEILKAEAETKMEVMKKSMGLDADNLLKLCDKPTSGTSGAVRPIPGIRYADKDDSLRISTFASSTTPIITSSSPNNSNLRRMLAAQTTTAEQVVAAPPLIAPSAAAAAAAAALALTPMPGTNFYYNQRPVHPHLNLNYYYPAGTGYRGAPYFVPPPHHPHHHNQQIQQNYQGQPNQNLNLGHPFPPYYNSYNSYNYNNYYYY